MYNYIQEIIKGEFISKQCVFKHLVNSIRSNNSMINTKQIHFQKTNASRWDIKLDKYKTLLVQ